MFIAALFQKLDALKMPFNRWTYRQTTVPPYNEMLLFSDKKVWNQKPWKTYMNFKLMLLSEKSVPKHYLLNYSIYMTFKRKTKQNKCRDCKKVSVWHKREELGGLNRVWRYNYSLCYCNDMYMTWYFSKPMEHKVPKLMYANRKIKSFSKSEDIKMEWRIRQNNLFY